MTLRVAAKDIEYSRTNEIVGPCRAEQRACTGGDDFPDFEGEVVADSGDGLQVGALGHHRSHVLRMLADRSRRIAGCAHPERIGALNFEQVGNLAENLGGIGIVNRHGVRSLS